MRWLCAAQALHVLSIENFDQVVKCALSCCTDDTGTESEPVRAQHPVDKCSPAFRLRVGEYRVFYDVDPMRQVVTALRVLSKEHSLQYLEEIEGGGQ